MWDSTLGIVNYSKGLQMHDTYLLTDVDSQYLARGSHTDKGSISSDLALTRSPMPVEARTSSSHTAPPIDLQECLKFVLGSARLFRLGKDSAAAQDTSSQQLWRPGCGKAEIGIWIPPLSLRIIENLC